MSAYVRLREVTNTPTLSRPAARSASGRALLGRSKGEEKGKESEEREGEDRGNEREGIYGKGERGKRRNSKEGRVRRILLQWYTSGVVVHQCCTGGGCTRGWAYQVINKGLGGCALGYGP